MNAMVDLGAYEFQGACAADVDGSSDGQVNVNDLLSVINNWGPCLPGNCGADVTDDNHVNVDDLLAVINAWGACP